MEVENISLLFLSHICHKMELSIRFLAHILLNKMALLKGNTSILLKPQLPFCLKLLCILPFGLIPFLLQFSWSTCFPLQFLVLFLPGPSYILPLQTCPSSKSLVVHAVPILGLAPFISLTTEPRSVFS